MIALLFVDGVGMAILRRKTEKEKNVLRLARWMDGEDSNRIIDSLEPTYLKRRRVLNEEVPAWYFEEAARREAIRQSCK